MKRIICTFVSVAVLLVFAIVSANAQSFGTRVEASIPFDFTVGNKTFKAGNYKLSIVRNISDLYLVSVRDENGRSVFRTIALRSPRTSKHGSQMRFAVVGSDRYLENIATPEVAYSFRGSYRNKDVAQTTQVSVTTSGAPQL